MTKAANRSVRDVHKKANDPITRRDFLRIGGGLLVGSALSIGGCGEDTSSNGAISDSSSDGSPNLQLEGRVVHVHSKDATSWDFGQDYYGRFVNQGVVDDMINIGLMELTGASSAPEAWRILIPDYAPGKAIAIKVNFNCWYSCADGCETGCEDSSLAIDAVIHPINSVVQELSQIGVVEEDIWIYDATPGRAIPGRFRSGCLFPNVRFFDSHSCREQATFESSDGNAQVVFSPPLDIPIPPVQKITDVIINASYLINMPIMKKHGVGVTLSFKNHFGTISQCSDLHPYVFPPEWGGLYYRSGYNPLVDIYRNPHILNKTVLIIGDGLYANSINNFTKPQPWTTFGDDAPNSLFFATDPVAVDCVMCDLLNAEAPLALDTFDDYLVLAHNDGVGTYERGDPWQEPYGSGYDTIQYIRRDI